MKGKKINNKPSPLIPKLKINPHYNLTIYQNKICPNRNFNRIGNIPTNIESSSKFNNYLLLNKKTSGSPGGYLFKTIWTEANSSLKHSNKKNIFLKTSKPKFAGTTNRSQKVSMKLLNDFFKPELTKSNKSILTSKRVKKSNNIYNSSTDLRKEVPPHNYLYFYFPNLFNVPNNRIVGPEHLNSSKFLTAPLPTLSFKEEVKNLKVSRLKNKNNEIGKNMGSSIISDTKEKKSQKNPFFIEKFYNIDVLKNVRFGFKNSIEKSKYKNLIKAFCTAKNLKYVFPKSE